MPIPSNLVFIQAVSHDPYMQWQIEVQITNFRKFGVSNRMQVLVWHPKGSDQIFAWEKIREKYPEVKIYYYQDRGVNLGLYLSQLRPHILRQHFAIFGKDLEDKVFFYHDQDIIFNYLPDFEKLCSDNINWQSNCSGYLDYNYLRDKEKQGGIPENKAIEVLANIGKVDVETIKSYTGKTGGAQCILKNIDYTFWDDVERQCVEIRKNFWYNILTSINRKYFKSENDGFQSWCADMWALNMALWNRGKVTDITPELEFSWATSNILDFITKPIFHNAGSTGEDPNIFHKAHYIHKSPFNTQLPDIAETLASRQYLLAIKEVK